MRIWLANNLRELGLSTVLLSLLGLLAFVALRAGPLAPVPITVATVDVEALAPALFGIGTVEARFTHRIGPTFAGRVRHVAVQPGDRVSAGQVLGEMDPVDLDDRLGAQEAGLLRAKANMLSAEAQIRETNARKTFAETQAARYDRLLESHAISADAVAGVYRGMIDDAKVLLDSTAWRPSSTRRSSSSPMTRRSFPPFAGSTTSATA